VALIGVLGFAGLAPAQPDVKSPTIDAIRRAVS
jgi:hypothetical protein